MTLSSEVRSRSRFLPVAVAVAVVASVFVMIGGVAKAQVFCGGVEATLVVPGDWPEGTVFPGTDGDDIIAGTAGNDFIDAGLGNDMICGFAGDDILIGGGKAFIDGVQYGIGVADYGVHGGADWIWGNDGDDMIFGGPGPDNLNGNKGSDQIFGGNGNDNIWGGPGHDYPQNLDPSINLQQFESVAAGGAIGLDGGKGNDNIFGGTGKDIIFGGEGADYMDGGGQNDRIFGSTDGGETLIGGQGEDIVKARGTKDGDPPDQLDGSIGVDLIIGSWGTQSCIDGPQFATCELPATSVILDGAPPADLVAAVHELAAWLADPGSNPQPPMPAELATWLGGANPLFMRTPLEFRGPWGMATIDGQRVAVIYEPFYPRRSDYKPNEDPPGEDVLLYVDPGTGWELVGTRMDRYFDTGDTEWFGSGVRHVLVLGSDARPSETVDRENADSITVLSTDGHHAGAATAVPRHSWVEPVSYPVISYGGQVPNVDPGVVVDRAAFTMKNNGPGETVNVLTAETGLPIKGYLLTEFGGGLSPGTGFTELVAALGGLDITLPYSIDEVIGVGVYNEILPAGQQILDGPASLFFSRNRLDVFDENGTIGEIRRAYHNALMVEAVMLQVRSNSGWEGIPGLLDVLMLFAETDLTPTELLQLSAIGRNLDPALFDALAIPSIQQFRNSAGTHCQDGDNPCADGVLWTEPPSLPAFTLGTNETDAEAVWRDLDDGKIDG